MSANPGYRPSYPWQEGDHLFSSELNAAIANASSATSGLAGVVNVKYFGAKGDGVTDDTAALNAAACAIPVTGGALYLPKGRYSISGTLFVLSLTRVFGDGWGSVLVANSAWPGGTTYQLILNCNYTASTITDHDIIVQDLAFDYTNFPAGLPAAALHGGIHCVGARMARNIQVRNCHFEGGTLGNDATAFMACDTTLVANCVSLNMSNCAYDHWWGPRNAKVVNCYASGANASVLFNPEPTTPPTAGFTANNFLAQGNTFIYSGSSVGFIQLEPLGPGTTLNNVIFTGNTVSNMQVISRRATTGIMITENVFINMSTGNAIAVFPADGGTPAGVVVANNVIINPVTSTASPITVTVDQAVVTGNVITGTAYGSIAGIDTSTNKPIVFGNLISNGIQNTTYSAANHDYIVALNGKGFGWQAASGTAMAVLWTVGADNHWILNGSNSAGGQRPIMDMYQQSDNSTITWSVPTAMTSSLVVSGICELNGHVGFNGTFPIAKPTITGAKGGNAALAALLAALASYGLITDSTT